MNPRYTVAVVATTAVAFTIGTAQALYVTATLSSGCTLTLLDATTVAIGNAPIGTTIYIACTMATFSAGGLVALK